MNNDNQLKNLSAKESGLAFSLMMVIYLLITLVGQAILLAITGLNSNLFTMASSLFCPLAIFIVLLVYRVKNNFSIKECIKSDKSPTIAIIAAILLSVGMMFTFGNLNSLFIALLESLGIKANGVNLQLGDVGQLIYYSITFALLPAILEELLFRGVIVSGLSKIKYLPACLLSALVFALYHGSMAQFLYQFIYGALLFVLAQAFLSVTPAIIAHLINNLAVIVLLYFKIDIDLSSFVIIAIGVLCLSAFALLCAKQTKVAIAQRYGRYEKGLVKEFLLPFGAFGLLICLTLVISSLL